MKTDLFELEKNMSLEKDKKNSNMKVGVLVGVFDLFHMGHLNLIKEAKQYCKYLVVGVHLDTLNIKNTMFAYSIDERVEFVSSIKYVDSVMQYEKVDELLKNIDFDIFFHGPDQNHQLFQNAFKYCRDKEKEIIQIDRTPGISSSSLRQVLDAKEI
ncbi:adenylyltransferase/cytidyltransferase family protein [Acinetobacter towneri]|uniref:adenylyltransferase/cytidyltransferase family protein n=1 Tax=Acinetobacter towneri TaxID=202956 RepID=UPI003A874977